MKWTYKTAQKMYNDARYYTLTEIGQRYNAGTKENVRSILYRQFNFPSILNCKRRKRYRLAEGLLGYIAGIVDGEGYIVLKPTGRLVVTNTDTNLIQWLQKTLGGSIFLRRMSNPKHRQSFAWSLTIIPTRGLLPLLIPFLIVKKARALQFIEKYCGD